MVKKMNETPNLELFYDVLDESINKLYEVKKQSFFKLLIETGRNIIAQDVLNKEATPEQKNELMEIYHKLDDVDFNVEETELIATRTCVTVNLNDFTGIQCLNDVFLKLDMCDCI